MSNNKSGGGMSFGWVVLTVFVVLKLCHLINWSWWWVLAPIWISLGILGVAFAVILAAAGARGGRR